MSNEPNIRERVLEKIRRGEVSMRPRSLFTLRVAAVIALSVIALLLGIFVLSFVLFSVHESGEQFLLGFGAQGVATFVALFPWRTFALSIVLLVALEALLRTFSFGYRLPLLRIFFTILFFAALGSALVSLTPLHASLLDAADHDQLPILGPFYEQLHDAHTQQGVYRGVITTLTPTGFVISHNDADRDSDEGTWTVAVPPGFATSTLSVGENVYVAGNLTDGVVQAYGVQTVRSGR